MKLQIALDLVRSEAALEMVSQIHDVIDVLEVGTPMILREGMLPVRLIKQKFPDVTVLADCKIVEGGDIESQDAFEAGADIVTVLAVSNDKTIQAVINKAKQYGKKVMVDMICMDDVKARSVDLDRMGVNYICIHTAVDVQSAEKTPFKELAEIMPLLKNAKAAVAGGINMDTIPLAREYGPEIVVVGSALTRSADLRSAVIEMKEAIRN